MFEFKLKSPKKNFFNEKWWLPTRSEWLPALLNDNRKFWISQTSPYGIPWKPLTRKYSLWKTEHYGNQPILRATGRMQDTAQIKSWGNRIFVKAAAQGIYHQYGTRKMASRPWMGVPDVSMQRLPGIAWKYILK
jgi:hypothetical protein